MKIMLLLFFLSKTEASLIHSLPWEDYVIIPVTTVFLTLIAGIMSGLTLGLMGIDKLSLELKLETGTNEEKIYAKRILPLLEDRYLLLVTLLIANSIALETMPILLEEMVGGVPAVILSVILSLCFSEVIPQSLCTGKYQIQLASAFANFIKVVIYVFYPISYIIARLLDKVIGKKVNKILNFDELKVVFKQQLDAHKIPDGLSESQVCLIINVIEKRNKQVSDLVIPAERMFSVSGELELSEKNLEWIKGKGFSRIPTFDLSKNFIGIFEVKFAAACEEPTKVKDLIKDLIFIDASLNLVEGLQILRSKNSHLALVVDENKLLGLISVKDIIRELSKPEENLTSQEDLYLPTDETIPAKSNFTKRFFSKFQRTDPLRSELLSDIELDKYKSVGSSSTIILE